MTSHSLVPFRESDVGEVARIHALSFDEAWSGPMLRSILAMPGTDGIVARSDLRWSVSGFAFLRVVANECELLALAVAPDRRGAGVGGLLLDGAMARAREAGARRLFLEVAEDNRVARRLYDGCGLRPVGRRPGYYRRSGVPAVTAVTMARDLETPRQASSG